MGKGKDNGDGTVSNTAQVTIIANLDTGQLQMQHPNDLTVVIQILGNATAAMGRKMVEQAQKATSVVTAPAGALNRLKRLE